jgi:hypothetical protein
MLIVYFIAHPVTPSASAQPQSARRRNNPVNRQPVIDACVRSSSIPGKEQKQCHCQGRDALPVGDFPAGIFRERYVQPVQVDVSSLTSTGTTPGPRILHETTKDQGRHPYAHGGPRNASELAAGGFCCC